MTHKLGATVRQNVKPITGVVIERVFNESEDQVMYHVQSVDADVDGVPDRRWFLERDIEAAPDVADKQTLTAADVGSVSATVGETS